MKKYVKNFKVPLEALTAVIDGFASFQATTGETLILNKLVNGKEYVMWEVVSPTNIKARATIEIEKKGQNKTQMICIDGSGLLVSIGLS